MPARWYRSLYWRIAMGFVACLAAMLVVQAVLFVWVVENAGPTLPGQPPDRFAQTVALDLGEALGRDPSFDVARFVRDQYGRDAHPFFVMMADGSVISNGGPFPEPRLWEARARLQRDGDVERPDSGGRYERYGRGGRGAGPGGPPPYRPGRPVPIFVHDRIAGVVVVEPRAPFPFLLRRYAPTLASVAAGSLVVGTLLATVIIFGPARKRLRAVEEAARRLGGGDLSARAPATGGDEVAAVAAAFNAMATDLGARADALATSDRVRRQLLADVSHELTTPVTAMRGYLETLTMSEMELDAATRTRYLSIIGDETARLEGIIGDLLEMARLEGGGGALVVEEVSVAQLFGRIVARHERPSADARVRITTAIAPGAECVKVDGNRLEQALQNLAANALRYAPPDTEIELTARPDGQGVTITVSNRGAGIAAEHLPHVFDRFYKAEPSRSPNGSSAGGSGLGLSIVKAIVERHGARVSVASDPGHTTFTIAGLASCDPAA